MARWKVCQDSIPRARNPNSSNLQHANFIKNIYLKQSFQHQCTTYQTVHDMEICSLSRVHLIQEYQKKVRSMFQFSMLVQPPESI